MVEDMVAMEDSIGSNPTGDSQDTSYSTTNTQVSGVDEGDIVKNDDRYAYIASEDRQSLFIIDAYPANGANIVSEIQTEGSIMDIYISGDLLIVIRRPMNMKKMNTAMSHIHHHTMVAVLQFLLMCLMLKIEKSQYNSKMHP